MLSGLGLLSWQTAYDSFSQSGQTWVSASGQDVTLLVNKVVQSQLLPFAPGDVIQTAPRPGYWGCAVVLSAFPATTTFHPRFHIGITPLIFRHAYRPDELNLSRVTILQLARTVRTAPGTYVTQGDRLCVGIYTARARGDVRVIGVANPLEIYSSPLGMDVGDGTSGAFPLRGPLNQSLGWEAVVAWRQKHDAEAFGRELTENREQFEEFERQRLANQRARRRAKRRDA